MAYVVFFGGLGMVAGALARWMLGWLRRGAQVPPPWCELAVGVAWSALAGCWAVGQVSSGWFPLLLGLAWLTVAAGAVDLVHRRLPDALTLPALPAALLLVVPLGWASVGRAAAGAAVLAGAYLAVRLVAPSALGAGDVKLAGPVGAVLATASWPAVVLGAMLAALLTAVAALIGLLSRRWGLGAAVPHGPAMLVSGCVVAVGAALAGPAGFA
jgi:leader peptidase (prepilin peptidase)/N-methyltransferase